MFRFPISYRLIDNVITRYACELLKTPQVYRAFRLGYPYAHSFYPPLNLDSERGT